MILLCKDLPNTDLGPIVFTHQSDDGSGFQTKSDNFTSNTESNNLTMSFRFMLYNLLPSAIKYTSFKDVVDISIPRDESKRVKKTYRDQFLEDAL